MVNHELKIEHEWLWRIRRGLKTHEVRKHDRDYQVGDTLILQCTCSRQPPEICHARVTHVLTHEAFPEGIQPGYCVLSLGDESALP